LTFEWCNEHCLRNPCPVCADRALIRLLVRELQAGGYEFDPNDWTDAETFALNRAWAEEYPGIPVIANDWARAPIGDGVVEGVSHE
jgi:hypothetical protein